MAIAETDLMWRLSGGASNTDPAAALGGAMSTAATHTNGTAVYHDWSAGEADSTVHGPASSTDGNFALYDGGTGKKIKDGPALVTTVGATGDDTSVPTEQAVREAIAAPADEFLGGALSSTPPSGLCNCVESCSGGTRCL